LLQRIRQQDQTAFAHYDLMLVTLKSGDANEADMRAVKNIDILRGQQAKPSRHSRRLTIHIQPAAIFKYKATALVNTLCRRTTNAKACDEFDLGVRGIQLAR
jgi:hypothetical protein